jgi:hypothetical protein
MSSSSADVEEQTNSSNVCFHFIPSINYAEQLKFNSVFILLKIYNNLLLLQPVSRTENTPLLFTLIISMSQDPIHNANVRHTSWRFIKISFA